MFIQRWKEIIEDLKTDRQYRILFFSELLKFAFCMLSICEVVNLLELSDMCYCDNYLWGSMVCVSRIIVYLCMVYIVITDDKKRIDIRSSFLYYKKNKIIKICFHDM